MKSTTCKWGTDHPFESYHRHFFYISSLPRTWKKITHFTTVHGFVVHGLSRLNVVHRDRYKVLVFCSLVQVSAHIYEDAFRFMSLSHLGTERFSWVQLEPIPGGYGTWLFAKKKKGPYGSHSVYCRTWRELNFSHEREEMLNRTWCATAFLKLQVYFTATSFNSTMSIFNFINL
jgi:hypothetical protein